MPYIILQDKEEDIFQKGRKVLSSQITKILRTIKKMNGSLVQITKSELMRSFHKVMGIESILSGMSGSINRKYRPTSEKVDNKKEVIYL